jgi:single-stranded-DNA-specific exonuclease
LLGRVATDIVERTGRPVAVLLERRGELVGELRAPEGVHLVEILGGMRDRLASWGGHRAAAGFSAPADRAEAIVSHLAEAFDAFPGAPARSAEPDGQIRRAEIDARFSRSLRAAMPFGKGNPSPVFRVLDYRTGGTTQELDDREGVGIRLFETDFPEHSEEADPLVTFQPRGGGGLAVRFVDWAD